LSHRHMRLLKVRLAISIVRVVMNLKNFLKNILEMFFYFQ
jgi:hypothetical protein